jgi:circadian clock protein KaiA
LSALLTIAILVNSPQLLQQLHATLSSDRYVLQELAQSEELLNLINNRKQEIDCLVLEMNDSVLSVLGKLRHQGAILPAVFLAGAHVSAQPLYHASELMIRRDQITDIEKSIDQAISDFLALTPVPDQSPTPNLKSISFLLQQQRRLTEKLKERLGYLAIYYNRNSELFFRNLSSTERDSIYDQLKGQYREIVLAYFAPDLKLNNMLDEFVTLVFCADLSVSEVVELHMDLMEDFSKQLKLEGWSEDVLLDYRLTLIDVIAHLCEMYRRSVPRERL